MKSDSARYVLVGNSTAAVAAVEGIRSVDPTGRIVLISREEEHTYSRPLISHLLAGHVDEARMDYRPRDFYARHGVEARLGIEVGRVDAARRELELPSGGRLGFEKLLVATGGSPVVPEVEGRELAGVFSFTAWSDARALRKHIEERKPVRAVVVGGGMIGIKAVEALVPRGLSCTVVELAPHVLSLALDEAASVLAEDALRRAGVAVECNASVEKIIGKNGCVSGAVLKGGRRIECELLVFAIGVRPNVAAVKDTPVKVDRGILVNERQETSVPGIFAAGDVAQVIDVMTGQSRPIPILPGAYRQGRIAGMNMAGGSEAYEGGLAMNAIAVFDLPTISVGVTSPPSGSGYEEMVAVKRSPPSYRKVVLKGNRVVGAVFVGDIERAGIYTGLIRNRIDVSGIRQLLLTEEFGVLALPAEYRKHLVSGAGIEV
jgi:NAD(P)H-nitrite reductase large subunit